MTFPGRPPVKGVSERSERGVLFFQNPTSPHDPLISGSNP